MGIAEYDPFARGPCPVGTRTVEAADARRGRVFPCEIWSPAGGAGPGPRPLVVFSHYSGGHRRSATFLCTHLASHGYAVAALDHSEVVATGLAAGVGETAGERSARIDAVIASRVPDVRFLLDYLLDGHASGVVLDARRVGLAGHSLGGWTALATPESDPRVRAVVAMAPGGSSRPRPGVLPLSLTFAWRSPAPVLYLAAEDDVPVPLAGVHELFDRTPQAKQLVILRHADHQHFADDVEANHEALRAMTLPGEAAWIPAAMRPIAELCPGDHAHLFARGLTLAHLDATLRGSTAAARFLAGDLEAELAARGVEAITHRP